MKKAIILLIILAISFHNFAQVNPHNETVYQQGTSIYIKEIQPKIVDIPYAVYLTDYWSTTTLYLNSEYKIENLKCKYDINSEYFEINLHTAIKILHTSIIDSFSYINPDNSVYYYVNCKHFAMSEYMHGFLRILSSGKITLLEKPAVKIIEADYNIALDVGHKERRYVKTYKLYVITDVMLTELPRKKKIIKNLFLDKSLEIEKYRKDNKLKLKKSDDLAKIITYYNQIK